MQAIGHISVAVATFILGVPLFHSISNSRKGRNVHLRIHRWWIICCFMFLLSLLSGLLFGFAGVLASRIPSRSTRHPAHCKILSKVVELRSSKTCRYGDLSSVSLGLFGSPDSLKFRCKLDYYWVSAFQVEYYVDDSSSPTKSLMEIPKERLPSPCRPRFADIWRVKDNFELNHSYSCLYSGHGLEMKDNAFQETCVAKPPSTFKLFQDYVLLTLSSYDFSHSHAVGRVFWAEAYAALLGLAYSVLVTLFSKSVSWLYFKVLDPGQSTFVDVVFFQARLQIACLILALTIATVLSTTGVEELRLGLQMLTGINVETPLMRKWLGRLFFSR